MFRYASIGESRMAIA